MLLPTCWALATGAGNLGAHCAVPGAGYLESLGLPAVSGAVSKTCARTGPFVPRHRYPSHHSAVLSGTFRPLHPRYPSHHRLSRCPARLHNASDARLFRSCVETHHSSCSLSALFYIARHARLSVYLYHFIPALFFSDRPLLLSSFPGGSLSLFFLLSGQLRERPNVREQH